MSDKTEKSAPQHTPETDPTSAGPEPNRRKHPRHNFRARSHADAHADHAGKPAPTIPQHPLIPRNQPALLTTQDALAELIDHCRAAKVFAYDSEFIGELSYFPKLCLIQVATAQRVALIDPLADLDLADFWKLIADPTVEKIVHAGEQDLEPVHRHVGLAAANVFDTQVAAGFCGFAYPAGLSKLVRELIGVSLGKGFTFTHWDQRPLTPVQIRYAADDVRYLPALRDAIGQCLDRGGRAPWVKEECANLCDPSIHHLDPAKDFLRIRGVGALSPRNAAVLRELFIWREDAARRHDSPPRSFVKDEILLDIAKRPVNDVASLDRVKGLPRPVEEEEGQNIVAAVAKGLSTPESDWPIIASTEETPRERFVSDSLWATVQAWCHGHGIDPALVTSRNEITRFHRERGERSQSNKPSKLLTGWRAQLLTPVLNHFLSGSTPLRMTWDGNDLRATAG